VVSPCVFSIWQNGYCRGLVVGRIEIKIIQPKFGYFKLPGLRIRRLIIIHEGIIGDLTLNDAKLIIDCIKRLLSDKKVDMVEFNSISIDSPLIHGFHSIDPSQLKNFNELDFSRHWELTLKSSTGFLLQSMKSKHRSWIKKKSSQKILCQPKISRKRCRKKTNGKS